MALGREDDLSPANILFAASWFWMIIMYHIVRSCQPIPRLGFASTAGAITSIRCRGQALSSWSNCALLSVAVCDLPV